MNAFSPQEQRELELLRDLNRVEAKDDFEIYYRRMTGFSPQPHHRVTCKLLQAMEDDKIDRAMVFMPRRMAKSTLCTQLFPSWLIGRDPYTAIMSAVHTQNYANKTGKIVRNLLKSKKYPFDVRLADDSQAKHQWATESGGEYNGFGLMGGSTHGNPAEWLIMDDLIKGRKMALSDHMRDEAWETYNTDLASSLQGRQKQLMVTTRWHEDDVCGHILPEDFDGQTGWYKDRETGESWYVLSIPAECEHENDPIGRAVGEYMWADKFGKKFDNAKKRGGFIWSALFQQRPSPEEGLMFQDDHIQIYERADLNLDELSIYITSDYAVTEEAGKKDPDYTVHTVWGIDPDYNIYMLDMWRGRTESNIWVDEFIRLCKLWKPIIAGEEQGQIIKGVGPFLKIGMREEGIHVWRKQYTSSISKEQRAQTLLGFAANGKFFVPRGHPMTQLFITELKAFPAGKHDDMVDTATLMGRMMSEIIAGTKKRRPDSPHGETINELFIRNEEYEED